MQGRCFGFALRLADNLIDKIVRVQNDQMFKDKLYKKDLLHKIKLGNYKVVIALFPERQISQLFHKAGIPVRIGTGRRFHSVFYNNHIYHSRKENKKHESQYNLDFLKFFENGETINTPRVYPSVKELKNARRILSEVGAREKFIIIHPGSGGSAERWPLEKFINLYKTLLNKGYTVVISGSEQEGKVIISKAKEQSVDLRHITGETDLRTLAAVLSLADVVVANSTGPLHLAAAVGSNVVGLYPGRQVMSPVRWGPLGVHHCVMQPQTICKCPHKKCTCMDTINVEEVADKVIELHQEKTGLQETK